MNRFNASILSAAVSGLLLGAAGCASTDNKPADSSAAAQGAVDKHMCKGKNECKGKGGCAAAAARHACAGKNECKGMGACKTATNECAGKNECKGKGGCAVPPNK